MSETNKEHSLIHPLEKGGRGISESFIPYNPELTKKSKELRKNMTEPEKKLWFDFLRTLEIPIVRQKPLLEYIVDFYISSLGIVIEIDGESHFEEKNRKYDEKRTQDLEKYNLQVLRYTNKEVMENFQGVCENIKNRVEERKKSPQPPFS